MNDPELSRVSSEIAGTTADAHCWEASDWTRLAEHFDALGSGEFWLAGLAVPETGRIDLSPDVCVPVRRFLLEGYAPRLSIETFELSQALVVLAHEAEHLRSPSADEDEVECYALQRVRRLVRDAGGGGVRRGVAGLAWDIGYPQKSDEYRRSSATTAARSICTGNRACGRERSRSRSSAAARSGRRPRRRSAGCSRCAGARS